MRRLPDWEHRLHALHAAWQGRAYAWGRHDCGRFAAAAVLAVTGEDRWPAGLAGYRTERGMVRALRRMGWRRLDDAFTAALGQPLPPLMAHRGDVVSDGRAVGVMFGAGAWAFGHHGLVMMARESLTRAWAVGRADG